MIASIVRLLRRYWYVCALLLVVLIVTVSFTFGWMGKQLSPSPQNGHSAISGLQRTNKVATRKGVTTAPTVHYTADSALVIPTIGVNAPIEPVGVLPTGEMAVPTHNPWTGVGWYRYGPQPGMHGSAVIDGHLDRPGGSPAVFWWMHKLHVGDRILVVQHGKKTIVFRVAEMDFYSPQHAPLSRIFHNAHGTFLNLITCAGTWIPQIKQTTLRLVVYSVLVSN